MHPIEDLLIKLRTANKTAQGREQLRRRVIVEHKLARVDAIQAAIRALRSARKNELDLNRTVAVINLLEIASLRAA